MSEQKDLDEFYKKVDAMNLETLEEELKFRLSFKIDDSYTDYLKIKIASKKGE